MLALKWLFTLIYHFEEQNLNERLQGKFGYHYEAKNFNWNNNDHLYDQIKSIDTKISKESSKFYPSGPNSTNYSVIYIICRNYIILSFPLRFD